MNRIDPWLNNTKTIRIDLPTIDMHKNAVPPHHCGFFFFLKSRMSRSGIPVTSPIVLLASRPAFRYRVMVLGVTPSSLPASILVKRTTGTFLRYSSVSSLMAAMSSLEMVFVPILFLCYGYDGLFCVEVNGNGGPFRPVLTELGCPCS